MKEATNPRRIHDLYRLNFNPRLREGGDPNVSPSSVAASISIHASVKEATGVKWGICHNGDFNPRLREGGDRIILDFYLSIEISIHASVKEATSWRKEFQFANYFNPRLREGGDAEQ